MTSPSKKKRGSLADLFHNIKISSDASSASSPPKPGSVNMAQAARKLIESTFRHGRGSVSLKSLRGIEASYTIAMDEAYDYNVLGQIDPDDIFPEVISFGNELSDILRAGLTPDQETSLDNHIIDCLARMVFGSNMIENAGSGFDITLKLCHAIFRGEYIETDVDERDPDYKALKEHLMRQNLPANTEAVLRSRREIIQHAKATSYIIGQVCLQGKALSEDIILETHRILTYKVDAEGMPWSQYSGVYRTVDVRAGFNQFPAPSRVPSLMQKLIRNLELDLSQATDKGEIDPFALAAKYCHTFVNIHPFVDGNGRTCRMILNALLFKLGGTFICIGEQGSNREDYLSIAARATGREALYQDEDDEYRPPVHAELSSFTLAHARDSFRKLVGSVKRGKMS